MLTNAVRWAYGVLCSFQDACARIHDVARGCAPPGVAPGTNKRCPDGECAVGGARKHRRPSLVWRPLYSSCFVSSYLVSARGLFLASLIRSRSCGSVPSPARSPVCSTSGT